MRVLFFFLRGGKKHRSEGGGIKTLDRKMKRLLQSRLRGEQQSGYSCSERPKMSVTEKEKKRKRMQKKKIYRTAYQKNILISLK